MAESVSSVRERGRTTNHGVRPSTENSFRQPAEAAIQKRFLLLSH
jgi:hypothetical protein